jgi:hypothetical protein
MRIGKEHRTRLDEFVHLLRRDLAPAVEPHPLPVLVRAAPAHLATLAPRDVILWAVDIGDFDNVVPMSVRGATLVGSPNWRRIQKAIFAFPQSAHAYATACASQKIASSARVQLVSSLQREQSRRIESGKPDFVPCPSFCRRSRSTMPVSGVAMCLSW